MLIDNDRITHVGPDDAVPRPPDAKQLNLDNAVVLPGLVNLHTHLELTDFAGQVEDDEFVDWIRHIRNAKDGLSPDAFLDAARRGVQDAWRHGTTTVADTGDSGAVVDALSEVGGRGVVYHEVFGPDPADADDALRGLQLAVDRLRLTAAPTVRVGVSPHAPYTVSRALFGKTADWVRSEGLPVAVHIAESHAESALVTRNQGPFAEAWRRRGIPDLATARSPVAFLKSAGLLDAAPLAIHAVQIDREDAAMLASHGCAVATCPRSNLRHGHGAPPIRLLREAGVAFGIGTDSVASVGSLDLFAEAREVAHLSDLPAPDIVRLLTSDAAACIGLDSEIGTLQPGMRADIVILDLGRNNNVTPDRLAGLILSATPEAVRHTYVDGRLVYRRTGGDATDDTESEVP